MYTLAEFSHGPHPLTDFTSRRYQHLNSLWKNKHPFQVFLSSKYLKCDFCFRTMNNSNAAVLWTNSSQTRHGG